MKIQRRCKATTAFLKFLTRLNIPIKTKRILTYPSRNVCLQKRSLLVPVCSPFIPFRQLESGLPRRIRNDALLQSRAPIFKIVSQNFLSFKKDNKPKKNTIPRLILLQNPFKWLLIKLDFGVLKAFWDTSFVEKEFMFGTKQAISKVTSLISEGQLTELNGLLTKPARLSLSHELERNWGPKQRALLALKRDDIQITAPRKVYFIRIADKKFCDVDMAFLALKWVPINTIDSLIFTEIFARFHREYTPHSIPEWTIAYFKVIRFEVIRRNPR